MNATEQLQTLREKRTAFEKKQVSRLKITKFVFGVLIVVWLGALIYAIVQQSAATDARAEAEASLQLSKEKLAALEGQLTNCQASVEQARIALEACKNKTPKK